MEGESTIPYETVYFSESFIVFINGMCSANAVKETMIIWFSDIR